MATKFDQTERSRTVLVESANRNYLSKREAKIELTRHAARRCQQRAIAPESARLVKAFGERSFDGKGGIRYLMTANSIKLLGRAIGRLSVVEAMAGLYLVVSAFDDQTIITLGHRTS